MSRLTCPMGWLWSIFFQNFRISCGEWVEQVRSLRIGIRDIWKFDKSCTGPPNTYIEVTVIHRAVFLSHADMILAIWLVSVWYWHWVVGKSGWYFCNVCFGRKSLLKVFTRTLFFFKSAGNPKRGLSAQKGTKAPLLEGKRGSCQIFDTKIYQPSFPLVLVGTIPAKYWPIPTNNNKIVCERNTTLCMTVNSTYEYLCKKRKT